MAISPSSLNPGSPSNRVLLSWPASPAKLGCYIPHIPHTTVLAYLVDLKSVRTLEHLVPTDMHVVCGLTVSYEPTYNTYDPMDAQSSDAKVAL